MGDNVTKSLGRKAQHFRGKVRNEKAAFDVVKETVNLERDEKPPCHILSFAVSVRKKRK